MTILSNRLKPICDRRAEDVVAGKAQRSLSDIEREIANLPPTRGFTRAVTEPGALRVIAEIKRASPSAGTIRADSDPVAIALSYEAAGASALSILTEPHWFHGVDAELQAARAQVTIPVLRKDFIVDPWQVAETRLMADACLLIVAVLGESTADYLAQARSYGLDALVEVHDEAEMDIALKAGAELIGVNNRDLTTFIIDLANAERLRPRVPPGIGFVAESGLETPEDFARMRSIDAQAVLVGSALMRAPEPGAQLRYLLGQ
ncbi:hypothetical protein VZ95_05270 [Elstera litoralis]|uniref:Indole-3-glycerol phosphate synthase n=1 Tax=Elstera litoralis TaxID=552518 RepID=A0A0F3IUJ7_9PROT|nr:indole-3-glycerol phosphate synthase TrpC [Elstera litoralis]KJV10381.1 hypothetical protein VZ95_05270 [Elstera litoralis]